MGHKSSRYVRSMPIQNSAVVSPYGTVAPVPYAPSYSQVYAPPCAPAYAPPYAQQYAPSYAPTYASPVPYQTGQAEGTLSRLRNMLMSTLGQQQGFSQYGTCAPQAPPCSYYPYPGGGASPYRTGLNLPYSNMGQNPYGSDMNSYGGGGEGRGGWDTCEQSCDGLIFTLPSARICVPRPPPIQVPVPYPQPYPVVQKVWSIKTILILFIFIYAFFVCSRFAFL